MTNKQTDFESQLKQQLAESVANIDATNLSRLNQARHKALSKRSKHTLILPIWSTGIAASVAGVLLIYLSLPIGMSIQYEGIDPLPLANVTLFDGEELDLYEDLDFYEWLVLEQHV